MTLIQPILILLLALGLALYVSRGRSKLLDRAIVFAMGATGIILVADPELSERVAHVFGVGRGVDLVIYLSLVGLAFLYLLVFSKIRALEGQITTMVRSVAIQKARESAQDEPPDSSRDTGFPTTKP